MAVASSVSRVFQTGATAATSDGQSSAVLAEAAVGLVNQSGLIDRMRTDAGGRLMTNDADLLNTIATLLRAILNFMVDSQSQLPAADAEQYIADAQQDLTNSTSAIFS